MHSLSDTGGPFTTGDQILRDAWQGSIALSKSGRTTSSFPCHELARAITNENGRRRGRVRVFTEAAKECGCMVTHVSL